MCNRLILIIGWAIFFQPMLMSGAEERSSLSFTTLLKTALEQSLEAKRSALVHAQAEADKEALDYKFWPQLGIRSSIGVRAPKSPTQNGTTKEQSHTLQLQYNIYDFGKTDARKDAVAFAEKVAAAKNDEVNEMISWQLARAYVDLAAAVRMLEISSESMAISESKLVAIRSNYEHGLRSQGDLVSAEGDLGTAKITYQRTKGDLQVKRRFLLKLIYGESVPHSNVENIWVAGERVFKDPKMWSAVIKDWKAHEVNALQKRRALELDGLRAAESAVLSSALPDLNVVAAATEGGVLGEKMERTYSGKIELSWDLPWPGMYRQQKLAAATQRRTLETDIAIEQKSRTDQELAALDAFDLNSKLWSEYESQLQIKQRQYQITKASYAAGKAPALELSNSELELANTKLDQVRIMSQLAASIVNLAEAKGIRSPSLLFQ